MENSNEMKAASRQATLKRIASGSVSYMGLVVLLVLFGILTGGSFLSVDNLTTDQIRAIYTGEITNWKQVGGEDAEIVPFQRNEGAGSQALMKKLVMGDTPLMQAPEEYYPGEMGMLMSAVKSYDKSANAIGYSVYYYAHDMEMAEGLKLLKVDGVEPNRDTIRSGEYPHRNAYYCVIAHDAPVNSPTRILYDWLMTPDGQALLESEGYVSNIG